MKFPYLKTPGKDPRKKWVSRPIIPIILFEPKGSINIYALIDSGADKCLFNSEIGKEIGLEIEKGKKEIFSGIEGGKLTAFLHPVELQIMGMEMRIEIEAGFVDSPGVSAILGQEGFFDAFKIKFERSRNVIEIIPVRKK